MAEEASEQEVLRPDIPPSRRRFLWMVTLGSGALMGGALAVPAVGFLLWPQRRVDESDWAPVGAVDQFPFGKTVPVRYVDDQALPWAGFAATGAAWVRRERERFVALSSYCTHTGCPVRWVEGAQMFLCPCHAGAFNREGKVVSGPPPAPLERLQTRVVDGRVEVRPSGVPLDAATEQAKGERAGADFVCPYARGGRGA